MIRTVRETKLEYGDFQTPLELAENVCRKLIGFNVNPNVIIEPTCGEGNFLEAAAKYFKLTNKIIGLEVNHTYLQQIEAKPIFQDRRVEIKQEDFFKFDWDYFLKSLPGELLIIGNFPWVNNSRQGRMGSNNLPNKNNFQNYNGLDAMTGKSNFDISEWMLIQVVQWLQNRDGYLAMLCKISVARKLLNYLHNHQLNIANCAIYKIDTQKYFGANVEACLLFCQFDPSSKNYFCNVFNSLEDSSYHRIGYRNNVLVRDLESFDNLSGFYAKNMGKNKWRSGIKHDCSKVMEFRKIGNTFVNGLGEVADLEETYLLPLLKGSDVAQNRIINTERYLLVTQRFVGETTEQIKDFAPKTWNYLLSHSRYLDDRKSKIYQNNPQFSIFGVGAYTFAPWKIAICGLYKQLDFRLVGKIDELPTVFDDTVYFLSFEDRETASKTFDILNSPSVREFYSSLIFWDEKRPIKSSILNSLNLTALVKA